MQLNWTLVALIGAVFCWISISGRSSKPAVDVRKKAKRRRLKPADRKRPDSNSPGSPEITIPGFSRDIDRHRHEGFRFKHVV